MKVSHILLLFSCFIIVLISCKQKSNNTEEASPQDMILSEPNVYNVRMLSNIKIDGKLDEASWQEFAVHWSSLFSAIEPNKEMNLEHQTKMKVLWDKDNLYVAAKIVDEHIWANMTENDLPLFKENCFELFIDPGADGIDYYEIEVNANNAVWDLFLPAPYGKMDEKSAELNYNIEGLQTAVFVEGSLNDPSDKDAYWIVEMAIPWKGLKEYGPNWKGPKKLDTWSINMMSVHWPYEIARLKYKKKESVKPDLAVWKPTGKRNIHIPEKWGKIIFLE